MKIWLKSAILVWMAFALAAQSPAGGINLKFDLKDVTKYLKKPTAAASAASAATTAGVDPGAADTARQGDLNGPNSAQSDAKSSSLSEAGFKLRGDGLTDTFTLLEKSCRNPGEYAQTLKKLNSLANGIEARANQLDSATRNSFQVALTDTAVLEAYYPEACPRLQRMLSCKAGQTVNAEIACDCGAGYPGETETGVGAVELILNTSRSFAPAACKQALDNAPTEKKARYKAQLGRALIYSREPNGFSEGLQHLNAAVAMGYFRARVDLARAALRQVEFQGAPAAGLSSAINELRQAKSKGAKDADMVLLSMNEVAAIHQWNKSFYKAFTAAVDSRPAQGPDADCGLVPSSYTAAAGQQFTMKCR